MRLPRETLRRLAGAPIVIDGQTLDVQIQVLCDGARRLGIPQPEDPDRARAQMDEDRQVVEPHAPPMATERDVLVPVEGGSIRARVYRPRTAKSKPGMLVYFHGGGFVTGGLSTHEEPLRQLAHDSGVVVCAVDYRKGPEHKFPAAPEDGLAAYQWARAHASDFGADPARVGVGGDSAGGNISAVVCHLAKERGVEQPTHQLLIYPATDWWRRSETHKTFAKGYILEEERTFWYEKHYLERIEERDDPRASPIRYTDFSGLAPATVAIAGFDILRDEATQYVELLERGGTKVDFLFEASLIHGFFNMGGAIEAAAAANAWIAARVREALG